MERNYTNPDIAAKYGILWLEWQFETAAPDRRGSQDEMKVELEARTGFVFAGPSRPWQIRIPALDV